MPMSFDELLAFVGQAAALSDEEVRTRCDRAREPEYWLGLCPEMSIGQTRPAIPAAGGPDTAARTAIGDYRAFGHCSVRDAFPVADMSRLRRAVESVSDAGWPKIFAFVYDDFWTINRSSRLHDFATALLGPGYQVTISFWVNHVPAERGNSGFPPHKDDVRPGHHTVTCWLPLTPATTENGCMYVIERDPDAGEAATSLIGTEIPKSQVWNVLRHVRALPAEPGAFLAWPNDTVHWGGMYLRGEPRLALTYHLASADYKNVDPALRLALSPDHPLPSLPDRLRWASTSMMRFRARDPLLQRFAPVAERLADTSIAES